MAKGLGISPKGSMARYLDRKAEILNARDRLIIEHTFNKSLAMGLSVWCNSATDASNIAAGFDDMFLQTGTGSTSGTFLSNGVLRCRTNNAATEGFVVAPISVAAANRLNRNTAPSRSNGFDIWVTWVGSFETITAQDAIFGFANVHSGGGSVLAGVGTPATGADIDFAGFVLDTSRANGTRLQFCVGTGADSGSNNYIDLGVTPVASQVYALTARLLSASGLIEVYVDGVLKGITTVAYRSTDDNGDAVTVTPFVSCEALANASKDLGLRKVIYEVDYTT